MNVWLKSNSLVNELDINITNNTLGQWVISERCVKSPEEVNGSMEGINWKTVNSNDWWINEVTKNNKEKNETAHTCMYKG